MLANRTFNVGRESCREETSLSIKASAPQDGRDLRLESVIKHPVGLVKHYEGHALHDKSIFQASEYGGFNSIHSLSAR